MWQADTHRSLLHQSQWQIVGSVTCYSLIFRGGVGGGAHGSALNIRVQECFWQYHLYWSTKYHTFFWERRCVICGLLKTMVAWEIKINIVFVKYTVINYYFWWICDKKEQSSMFNCWCFIVERNKQQMLLAWKIQMPCDKWLFKKRQSRTSFQPPTFKVQNNIVS